MAYKPLQQKELNDRLTAVWHVTQNHFTEHKQVEGYQQHNSKSDRLLKLDSIYGTIQLGYDPSRGKSFILANIKTSIYDSAPSAYMKNISDGQMKSQLKSENPNRAFTSQRKDNSSVLLFNAENKPWTANSIRPYVNRVNMESLQKTLPFLNTSYEQRQRVEANQKDLVLKSKLREAVVNHSDGKELAQIRAEQLSNLRVQEQLNSTLYLKDTKSRLWFRKLNMAFDIQKADMFEYYKQQRRKATVESDNELTQEEPSDENKGR